MTNDQKIAQHDWVDDCIFDLITELSQSSEMIVWDIKIISEIRDILQNYFVNELELCDKEEYYPTIE